MDFSNSTTLEGVIQEINRICNCDDNTYSLKAKTARVNMALDRFFTLAFQADGRWSFDDINQTTAPLQSISLVSGTEKYALDTFTSEIINILRVEALDANGNGMVLKRLNRERVDSQSLPQFNSVASTPNQYDLLGKYIYLYPKPNYSLANGLSLYIERNKVAFVSTDTTTDPGIPSIFHPYICRMASLPYLIEKDKPQIENIRRQIGSADERSPYYGGDELAIIDYFDHREKGVPAKVKPRYRNSR